MSVWIGILAAQRTTLRRGLIAAGMFVGLALVVRVVYAVMCYGNGGEQYQESSIGFGIMLYISARYGASPYAQTQKIILFRECLDMVIGTSLVSCIWIIYWIARPSINHRDLLWFIFVVQLLNFSSAALLVYEKGLPVRKAVASLIKSGLSYMAFIWASGTIIVLSFHYFIIGEKAMTMFDWTASLSSTAFVCIINPTLALIMSSLFRFNVVWKTQTENAESKQILNDILVVKMKFVMLYESLLGMVQKILILRSQNWATYMAAELASAIYDLTKRYILARFCRWRMAREVKVVEDDEEDEVFVEEEVQLDVQGVPRLSHTFPTVKDDGRGGQVRKVSLNRTVMLDNESDEMPDFSEMKEERIADLRGPVRLPSLTQKGTGNEGLKGEISKIPPLREESVDEKVDEMRARWSMASKNTEASSMEAVDLPKYGKQDDDEVDDDSFRPLRNKINNDAPISRRKSYAASYAVSYAASSAPIKEMIVNLEKQVELGKMQTVFKSNIPTNLSFSLDSLAISVTGWSVRLAAIAIMLLFQPPCHEVGVLLLGDGRRGPWDASAQPWGRFAISLTLFPLMDGVGAALESRTLGVNLMEAVTLFKELKFGFKVPALCAFLMLATVGAMIAVETGMLGLNTVYSTCLLPGRKKL